MGGEMPAPVPAPMIGRPFAQIGRSSSAARMRARTYSLLTHCPPRSATDATQARVCVRRAVVNTVAHARVPIRSNGHASIGERSVRLLYVASAIRLVACTAPPWNP